MAGDAPGTKHENQARPGVPPAPMALYRKYRPATFAEVKGQEHVTEPLRQALRSGRVHHAYLFSGPRGCGKTSSARILARSLNCEQGPTPDPCGVCASCVALAPSGPGSIDVIEIDAASHGGVDDARDLRERAFYAPVSGRFKIYIIDEAHMVTREGFNALLKLVEEPPPHLKFVFATTEPEKVIATIRSRTHHYPFRLVPPAVLRDLLEEILAAEEVRYQPAVLPLVVRAGAGSVRDSLSVLDQLVAGSGEEGLTYERTVALLGYTDDSLLDEMVDAFSGGDGGAAFAVVDRVVEGGHDPRRFAADLLDRLRDLIILAAVPGAGESGLLDAPADRLERMAEQAGRFGQAELTRAAEILSEGLIQMRGTTSSRLLLELMCAQVLLPAASTGEKALLVRLERLERLLEGAAAPQSGPQSGPSPGQQAGAAGKPGSRIPPPDAERPPDHVPGQPETTRPETGQPEATSSQTGRPKTASSQTAQPETRPAEASQAGTAGQGPSAPQPGAGAPADTDTLRRRWPDILAAVRDERKVAWMLLNTATVQSLDNRVLTVAFPSEGQAKGFAGSGHDQVLTGVLATMFGVNFQVRAVTGTPGEPRPPAQPRAQGGRATPPAPPEHAGPAGRAGSGDWTSPAGQTGSPGTPPSGGPARPGSGGRAAGGGRPRRAQPPPAMSAPADEEWPDEPDPGDVPASGPATGPSGLTGMDLIRHQLGGQIIAEIEDA